MTTLQQVIESVKDIKLNQHIIHSHKKGFALKFLGKFKDVIPGKKTSTKYIRELRDNLYEKLI